MPQPLLYIIADHKLKVENWQHCIFELATLNLEIQSKNYLQYAAVLFNPSQKIDNFINFVSQNAKNNEIVFAINGIEIYLRKNIIQFRFPFIFRVIADYDLLKIQLYELLKPILNACKSTEFAFYPSFWQNKKPYLKPWQVRRLAILQTKITTTCVSYKRTLLNLEHCLGKSVENEKDLQKKTYIGWKKVSHF
ncbi:MAG: hypothetical protein LBR36_06720 [Bacteroidales bacterium]|jgi:hypothetical protein|nr:hypothetical protein [Bacteroidales bacterium]